MSNLELITTLCGLVETEARIIAEQRKALLQFDALVAEDEIAEAEAAYQAITGAEAWPDAEPNGKGGNNENA